MFGIKDQKFLIRIKDKKINLLSFLPKISLKKVLILSLFVVIVILLSEHYFYSDEHGDFNAQITKSSNGKSIQTGLSELSISVKTYLDNYFNQKLLNESEIFDMAQYNTNLALKYTEQWNRNYSHSKSEEWARANLTTCDVKPPPIQTIHMNNIYWQTIVNSEDLNLYLYNSYYDNRQTTNKIRILGISDHFNKLVNTSLWCLFYFEGKRKSVLSKITEINELAYDFGNFYKRKGYYLPVLLTCEVPNGLRDLVPKAVAIKTDVKCWPQLNNLLRVIYNKPNNSKVEEFGVCVRALYYQTYDYSLRLLEWLEMIRILGSHKVFLYSFTIHPNMEKVINYYVNKNFVDWKHTTHAGMQLNHKLLDEFYVKRMSDLLLPQETLELNDCLYRNLYKYEYLALLDIDELIVPTKAYNWHDMLPQIHNISIINPDKKRFGSYLFSQTRFYNNLESDEFNSNKLLYTMRHLHRGNFTNKAPKSFHLTQNIKIIWNHSALKCIRKEDCPLHWVNKEIGYLVHYRPRINEPKNCSSVDLKSCTTFDTILVKYNEILETNVKIALNDIF